MRLGIAARYFDDIVDACLANGAVNLSSLHGAVHIEPVEERSLEFDGHDREVVFRAHEADLAARAETRGTLRAMFDLILATLQQRCGDRFVSLT